MWMRALVLSGLLALAAPVSAQTITQIIDSTGDGHGHPLLGARGLVVDRAGTVYVAGHGSHNVFRIAPDGMITQIMDASGDGQGNTLANPFDLALDAAGNLYVTGESSGNVFRIAPDGTITEILDATGDGRGNPLVEPESLVVSDSGRLFVLTRGPGGVLRVDPDGTITPIYFGWWPMRLALGPSDALYVTDFLYDEGHRIELHGHGAATKIIDYEGDGTGNPFWYGSAVAVGRAGVYMMGAGSNNVFRIERDGTKTQIIDGSGDGEGHLLDSFYGIHHPADLAVDSDENVYVAGVWSHNVFRVAPDGTITQLIDATGDGQGHPLMHPENLAVGRGGVYVSGWGSDNVFRIE